MNNQLINTNHFGSYLIELHYVRPLFNDMEHITSSVCAEKVLRSILNPKRIDLKEFFWVILLTNANRLLGVSELSIGCTHGVTVNCKEIFQLALMTNASGIIVAHNHPSGTLKPSDADIRMTRKLKEFAKIVEISLLDHIIITSEDYTSMTDNQLL